MKIDKILLRSKNEDYPASELMLLVDDIVQYAVDKISEKADDSCSDIKFVHPSTLTSVLICNLVINLAAAGIHADTREKRTMMFRGLVAEISCMLYESWAQLESQVAQEGDGVH